MTHVAVRTAHLTARASSSKVSMPAVVVKRVYCHAELVVFFPISACDHFPYPQRDNHSELARVAGLNQILDTQQITCKSDNASVVQKLAATR